MELFISVLILFGSFFIFLSALGILRFPDILTRLHAGSKGISFGVFFILISNIIHFKNWEVTLKIFVILFYLFITTPVIAHLIAKIANTHGRTGHN